MGFGLQWVQDKITFPSPPSSYSLTSHPELFFVKSPRSGPGYPGVPCMLYAVPQGAPVLLVHAHSNGCDIGDMRQTLLNISEALKVHVMAFEFPGYGLHVGSASMRSVDEAAVAVADFIIHTLKINISQVVWYGRSIGSGPAIRMVHRVTKELKQQPGGLIVQCGYANFPEVAGHLFGRVAKQLVSPLWPNEAMTKELECPVLLIHGRADTMIPISQSEKLWAAVKLKERSTFHRCECGHNDFNFRKCTLRPIYEFLLGVISSPTYPSQSFTVDIAPSSHTYVHHIGPLRSRIPVYSFRRPELEEWLRNLLKPSQEFGDAVNADSTDVGPGSGAQLPQSGKRVVVRGLGQEEGVQLNGLQGTVVGYDEQEDRWWLHLDTGESILLRARNLHPLVGVEASGHSTDEQVRLKANGRELQPTATQASQPSRRTSTTSLSSTTATKTAPATLPPPPKASKSRKAKAPEPPIPDFTEMPFDEEIFVALIEPLGMIKLCANRVAAFLDRIQAHLDRIEHLEAKPMEEVITLVEAEFWACDPFLSLWEEVSIPDGDRVRYRLGPYSVDNYGQRVLDRGLGTGCAQAPGRLLRQPMWMYTPSPAQMRCLAEWSLLRSQRLERNLSSGTPSSGSNCCCAPSFGGNRKASGSKAGAGGGSGGGGHRKGNEAARPTKGALASSFAALFVNWVEKRPEIKLMFSRFVALYENPENTLRRGTDLARASREVQPSLAPKEPIGDMLPPSPEASGEDERCRPALRSFSLFQHNPSSIEVLSPEHGAQKPFFPCLAPCFSSSSRSCFREGVGGLGSEMVDLSAPVWGAPGKQAALCDFQAASKMVADVLALDEHLAAQGLRRHLDWSAAGLLLHYERLSYGAGLDGVVPAGASADEVYGDPLRADVRRTAAALTKSFKAFLQSDMQDRRDFLGQMTSRSQPRATLRPGDADGKASEAALSGPRPGQGGPDDWQESRSTRAPSAQAEVSPSTLSAL